MKRPQRVPRPLDSMKLLRACERVSRHGVPFTWPPDDPRHEGMLENERRGFVVGTRYDKRGQKVEDPSKADPKSKVYWSLTTLGETVLANARAQSARDLAEAIRVHRMTHACGEV